MANWRGRGKGRLPGQPTLTFSSGPGFGGGRAGTQVTLALRSGPGMGSGRSGPQSSLQPATGQSFENWTNRGGGRSPGQPNLNPRSGINPQTGGAYDFSNWRGRGGGRGMAAEVASRNMEQAAYSKPDNWVGRGGGRSPMQPKIANANIMAAKRAMLNQASNMAAGALGAAGSALGGFFGSGALGRELEDPLGNYTFALEINHMEVAHFTECSGIKCSSEIYEIKEGGLNHAVHKLPGQTKWENITLRYGVTSDMSMLTLREYIMNDNYTGDAVDSVDLGANLDGTANTSVGSLTNALSSAVGSFLGGEQNDPGKMKNKRFSGSIIIKNNAMQEMVRYTFQQAWVVSWEGPKFNAEGSKLSVESIEIAHHGVTVQRSMASKNPVGWL